MNNQNQNPKPIPLPNQPNGTQGFIQQPHQILDETNISLDDVGEATKYEQDCLEFRYTTNKQRVTLGELGEATEYKHKVVEKKLGGLGAPIWATTMENNLKTEMVNLQNNILAMMENVEYRNFQRLKNYHVASPNDLLSFLPNYSGQYPNNFPAKLNDLKDIDDQSIDPILLFYGLNYQNLQIHDKKNALLAFLGVRFRF